jgi:hypothetical protein
LIKEVEKIIKTSKKFIKRRGNPEDSAKHFVMYGGKTIAKEPLDFTACFSGIHKKIKEKDDRAYYFIRNTGRFDYDVLLKEFAKLFEYYFKVKYWKLDNDNVIIVRFVGKDFEDRGVQIAAYKIAFCYLRLIDSEYDIIIRKRLDPDYQGYNSLSEDERKKLSSYFDNIIDDWNTIIYITHSLTPRGGHTLNDELYNFGRSLKYNSFDKNHQDNVETFNHMVAKFIDDTRSIFGENREDFKLKMESAESINKNRYYNPGQTLMFKKFREQYQEYTKEKESK